MTIEGFYACGLILTACAVRIGIRVKNVRANGYRSNMVDSGDTAMIVLLSSIVWPLTVFVAFVLFISGLAAHAAEGLYNRIRSWNINRKWKDD